MTKGLEGRTLAGRYDLLALLGQGGMGAVYRAHDRELDEPVALKVIGAELASRKDSVARFRSEVKLARRVTHRNVARTFELGHDGAITFCTMELIEGLSLRRRLAAGAQLPVTEAIAIACALCEGLAAAHAVGVIHRDIKPDNVLLATDGRVVLADFGIAVARIEGATEIVGTWGYMAPEQATGESATPAADVYAVGVVLYEMLSGTRAFPHELEARPASLVIPPAANVDAELAAVVRRATARDRAERFATANDLGQALAPWLSGRPTIAIDPSTSVSAYEMASVVVLPVTGDERYLHVAQAVHDGLVDRLSRQPRIRVLPRIAVGDDDLVRAIVALDVRDELHVTIARPGAASFELRLPPTIEDLDANVRAAAAAIGAVLAGGANALDPQAVEALELLFRARQLVARNVIEFPRAAALLERASQLAPGEPRILAALAVSHVRHAFFSDDASDDRLARGAVLVRAALAAGPELVDAHLAAGHFELHTGDAARAARHFRTAISCAPHAAEAHDHLGRLLLEAGFIDLGQARLDAARANSCEHGGRWELARAWALDGRWDAADREIARLATVTSGHVMPLVRHAWWRRDVAALAQLRTQLGAMRTFDTTLMTGAFASIIDGGWADWRERLVTRGLAPSPSRRRAAFSAQLVAEIAGYSGDRAICLDMIRHAIAAGMFDLHWLDRCPLLDVVRVAPDYARLRARVKRRADAILDALYGDDDNADQPDTVAD